MPFKVYEVALAMNRSVRPLVAKIRTHNPSLAVQMDKSAPSVPLNIREGNRRAGKDRLHHFRVAAGSADETRGALEVAEAYGQVEAVEIRDTLELIDRICAMLWRLTH